MVLVRAGTQSLVTPGNAPSDPTPLPSSLLLKVNLPASGQTLRTRKLTLAGKALPGAHLTVMGRTVPTDSSGHFEVPVNLREGENTVSVRALEVGGKQAQQSAQVRVDTTAPDLKVKPNWK